MVRPKLTLPKSLQSEGAYGFISPDINIPTEIDNWCGGAFQFNAFQDSAFQVDSGVIDDSVFQFDKRTVMVEDVDGEQEFIQQQVRQPDVLIEGSFVYKT